MPRRLSLSRIAGGLVAMAAAGLVAVLLAVMVSSSGAEEDPTPAAEAVGKRPALEAVEVTAGEVDVRVEPIRVDDAGAVFMLTFDTHSVELDLDVAGSSALNVDGVLWAGATWVGDPPGGHHRSGELFFVGAGVASDRMTLRIEGLPGPVVVEWDLGA